jgi:YgiT-type zinc finger domain-containing protein|tara:strand:+ start:663 stop:902 length:240 start_codon:yes stop_codon:yes gene_type:complete
MDIWGICYYCGKKMIQGGDHDEVDADGNDTIVSNFHCPNCGSSSLFWWPVGENTREEHPAWEKFLGRLRRWITFSSSGS